MQAKICSALAVLVLFAALAFGNPFLPAPRGGAAASPADAVPAREDPAFANRAAACPEPELASAVVAVRRAADGTWLWWLQDGRVLRRAAGGGAEFLEATGESVVLLGRAGDENEIGEPGDSAAAASR